MPAAAVDARRKGVSQGRGHRQDGPVGAMVTLGIDYDVRPGQQEQFEQLATAVVAALQAVPGHRQTRIYRDVQREHSYLIRSEWSSREALANFTRSQRFHEVRELGREILLGPPRHEVFIRDGEPLSAG